VKVVPICSDSLGVRSLCVYVETGDLRLLIDPGAALGPSRYGLPPAREEWEALARYKEEIRRIAEGCDALVISHYHYDHYDPDEEFWEGKEVFIKDPEERINVSQKERASYFLQRHRERAKISVADGRSFTFGSTRLSFSPPLPHGPEGTRLGYVLATRVEEEGFTLVHSSDVQGPVVEESARLLVEMGPDLLIVDGAPTYFLGWKFSARNLKRANENLRRILKDTDAEIILDHHLLRDLKYRERSEGVWESGRVKTFAEYLGKPLNMLEANRKRLFGGGA